MIQAIASGHIGSLAEGREALAASACVLRFAPRGSDAWDEAYERFKGLKRAG